MGLGSRKDISVCSILTEYISATGDTGMIDSQYIKLNFSFDIFSLRITETL